MAAPGSATASPRDAAPAPRSRYSHVAIGLHWLIALLVLGNLAGGLLLDTFLDSPDPEMKSIGFTVIQIHKSLGLTVLALTLLRLGWRLGNPPPLLPDHMTGSERLLAKGTHWLFYALLLLLPLSGWALISTSKIRFPASYFGLFDIPFLPLSSDGLAAAAAPQAHEWLGYVAIATIALHVAAALKHHYLDRDDVLARMLPWLRARA